MYIIIIIIIMHSVYLVPVDAGEYAGGQLTNQEHYEHSSELKKMND